jgi:hypothetical protein
VRARLPPAPRAGQTPGHDQRRRGTCGTTHEPHTRQTTRPRPRPCRRKQHADDREVLGTIGPPGEERRLSAFVDAATRSTVVEWLVTFQPVNHLTVLVAIIKWAVIGS